MNWYKLAQILTLNTKFDTIINLSARELLSIDDFVAHNKNEKIAKEILLRIIREHPEIIRMRTERKI